MLYHWLAESALRHASAAFNDRQKKEPEQLSEFALYKWRNIAPQPTVSLRTFLVVLRIMLLYRGSNGS